MNVVHAGLIIGDHDPVAFTVTILLHCTIVVTLRYLTPAATIHYQIGTPPVQLLPHNFTLASCGTQSLTLHPLALAF